MSGLTRVYTQVAIVTVVMLLGGCDDGTTTTKKGSGETSSAKPTPGAEPKAKKSHKGHHHKEGEEHHDDEKHTEEGGGDHPDAVSLGTKTVGGLKLEAKQAELVKAGGDGAFDLRITGGAKPKAVRFWVGLEDQEGSVVERAEEEEESEGTWHTHVEVPDPLPPGSQFWAEIEPQSGERFKVSFDLHR